MSSIWSYELSEGATLAYMSVRYLLFPAIVLLLGGITANLLFPRFQDRYLRRKAITERRGEIAEQVAAEMCSYVTNWRRLLDFAHYVERVDAENEQLNSDTDKVNEKELSARTIELAQQRNLSRDKLLASLSRLKLYCDKEGRKVIEDFLNWDEKQASRQLHELPKISEWRGWENEILKVSLRSLWS